MFASSWFWTQETSLITPIMSMTAMLLQVFGHKADLGDLLRENAQVRGIFSCLEMSGAGLLARVTVAGYIFGGQV